MALSGAQAVVSDTEHGMQLLCMNIEANKQAIEASSGKIKTKAFFLRGVTFHSCFSFVGYRLHGSSVVVALLPFPHYCNDSCLRAAK